MYFERLFRFFYFFVSVQKNVKHCCLSGFYNPMKMENNIRKHRHSWGWGAGGPWLPFENINVLGTKSFLED